jgi:DNA-binding GntR family transcriptional regulator
MSTYDLVMHNVPIEWVHMGIIPAANRERATNKSVGIVLDELRSGIQHGRYAPGQRLITSELASQLGTSLAPVREALHILAGEGLIEIQPNKGARVRTLTAQTFIDGLQVLEVIGLLGLRLAAPKIKQLPRSEIKEIRADIVNAGKRRNAHAFFTAIGRSHRRLNELTGNSYLNPILNRIHLEYFYRQMADYLPDDFWDQYVANYESMGSALAKGDLRSVEATWVRHVRWVIDLIQEHASQERISRPPDTIPSRPSESRR